MAKRVLRLIYVVDAASASFRTKAWLPQHRTTDGEKTVNIMIL